MQRSLITERTITYLAQAPGTAAGTLYNGVVAASTDAAAMAVGLGGDGKAIPIQNASRALIAVMLGVIVGTGTLTAWVTSSSEKADGASLTQIPDFSMSWVGTDDGKILKGEIDLRGVVSAAPVAGDVGLNLWIKIVGVTDSTVAAIVQLDGFEYNPTAEVATVLAPLALN